MLQYFSQTTMNFGSNVCRIFAVLERSSVPEEQTVGKDFTPNRSGVFMDYQPPHVWGQGIIPMEYPHPPFTSPPATPMTPMTPMTPAALNHHHHAFPIQYDVPPHLFPPNTPHLHPPPPFPPPADYRLFALCQHLQTYSKISESETKRWWEDFMTEFFHDNCTLVIETDLGEGTRKYHLARQWIPLYFQSLMENGVTSVHLDLGQCISTFHQSLQELECHSATMETNHTSPHPTKVCTNGSLVVDFSLEDKPRILSWYFNIIDHMEYVPRGNSTQQGTESGGHDNITIRGLLPSTQKLLLEASKLESNAYHDTPMAMSSTAHTSAGMHQRWQEMPALISAQSVGLDVNTGPLEVLSGSAAATMTTMMQQCMSPGGGVIPHSMVLCPSSSSSIVNTANTSSSAGKSKSNRSSTSNGGGSARKRHSPIPGSSTNAGDVGAKAPHQFMLVAAEAIQLKDADNLPLGPEERMITRVDNDHFHHQHSAPQTSPSASKSSPPNTNGHSNSASSTSSIGSLNGTTSKLCHLSSHQHGENSRALSHSTTVDSSAQGVELMQGPNELYETPLQPWASAEGIGVMNHSALASTR